MLYGSTETGSQPSGRGSDPYPATGWCTLPDCLNGSFARVLHYWSSSSRLWEGATESF